MTEFFMAMEPPTVTQQEHKITMVNGRPVFYDPPELKAAKEKLIANLRKYGVSLAVLSQFMPIQYTKVREGSLENDPEALIKDRIKNTIDEYLFASHQEKLF